VVAEVIVMSSFAIRSGLVGRARVPGE
jgi:hypothetical protein